MKQKQEAAPPTTVGAAGIRHRIVYATNHAPKKYLRAGKMRYARMEDAMNDAKQVNSHDVWVITENIEVLGVTRI